MKKCHELFDTVTGRDS